MEGDSEHGDHPDFPHHLRQVLGRDERPKRERPVEMDLSSRRRKRRPKKWQKHEPIDYRHTANCVRSNLYRLPIELFAMIMDYLDFKDILYLCQDPEFPVNSLRQRHLMDEDDSYSILHQIIDDGWSILPMVKNFMQILNNWNVPGPCGILPLNEAIVCERVDLCVLFIEAGARIDSLVPPMSPVPMPNFFPYSGMDDISRFLRFEADFFWAPKDSDLEPLHLAVIVDNLEIAILLLQLGADPNASAGMYGSALHLAESIEMALLLVAKGANVDALNAAGSTPLFIAVAKCRLPLVHFLLQSGADVDIHNQDSLSAITIACAIGDEKIVRELLNAECDFHNPEILPLFEAVERGNTHIARMLLKMGADPNSSNGEETPLHAARSADVAQLLISFGADINAQNIRGQTSLMLAVMDEEFEIFNALVIAGADYKDPSIDLHNILTAALFEVEYTTARLILSHCKFQFEEGVHDNPLPLLVQFGHKGMVDLLLETNPCLVNRADDEGQTPVCAAVQHSSPAMLERLLTAGASPNSSNTFGSALSNAIYEDEKEMAEVLLEWSAVKTTLSEEERLTLDGLLQRH